MATTTFSSTLVTAAKVTVLGVVAASAVLGAAGVASASPDWQIVDQYGNPSDGYVPSGVVGGTPSYTGVPGLLITLSAQTGLSCWTTAPYYANDGRIYSYACY